MPSDDKIITPTLSSVSGGNHPFAEICGKWTGSQVLSQEICIQVLALLKRGHGTLEIYSGFSCTKRSKWALHLYNPSFHFSVFLPAPSWLMWIGIYPRTTHDYFTKYSKIVVQLFSHIQLFANPWTTVMPGLPVLHQLPEFAQTHIHLCSWRCHSPTKMVSHFHCKNLKLKISVQQIQSGRLETL